MSEIRHEAFEREVPGARVCVLMVHGFLGSPHHFDMLLPHIPAALYGHIVDAAEHLKEVL